MIGLDKCVYINMCVHEYMCQYRKIENRRFESGKYVFNQQDLNQENMCSISKIFR